MQAREKLGRYVDALLDIREVMRLQLPKQVSGPVYSAALCSQPAPTIKPHEEGSISKLPPSPPLPPRTATPLSQCLSPHLF